MAAIWANSLERVRAQLETLENAAVAMLDNSLDAESRREAEREAHRLAGSAGSFGFHAASAAARELEHMLVAGAELDARRAAELAMVLRNELDTESLPEPPAPRDAAESDKPQVLVVEDDHALRAAVIAALDEVGLRAAGAATLGQAREQLRKHEPEAILLDLSLGTESGLDLLDDLPQGDRQMPVLLMTAAGEFADRVAAVRRGVRAFLHKPMPPGEIAANAAEVFERARATQPRVMAVDDDASVLQLLSMMLRKQKFDVTTVQDPREFWTMLEQARPDVLLLDHDMPHATGLEICKIVRSDSRWRALPIIFITSRSDVETITTCFEAGADDFIGKPVINAEVIARVRNRIERSRLLRQLADTDYLTGLANRRASEEAMRSYEHLANRYAQPLSLALLEIDDIKTITDTHGLAVADDALRAFGNLLRLTFRGEDIVARWGGEVFAVGMYGMSRIDGMHRLGELVERLEQRGITTQNGVQVTLTFTGGVAQLGPDGPDLRALIESAERTLRRARDQDKRLLAAGTVSHSNLLDVLVVEDDDTIAELLVHSLETRGYSVKRLADGQAALDAVSGPEAFLQPRVVLLDVDLPGLDGISVLRRWKQQGRLGSMRVIMLTVRSGEPEVVETLKLDAFDHVAKPFSTPVLVQRIRRALET